MALPTLSPVEGVGVSLTFDREFYFQGESGTVDITIENNNATSAMIVNQIGIWFDWLPAYSWILQLPQSTILIAAATRSAPLTIGFGVPSNASAGTHQFAIRFNDGSGIVHDLASGSIAIHDANEIVPQWLVQLVTTLPILTIVGIALSTIVTIYAAKRRRKVLSYELLSRTPVSSIEQEVRGKLKILHDGKEVTEVHLVELRLSNTGNVDIKPEDYQKEYPVTLDFGNQALVLTVEPVNPRPVDLKVLTKLRQGSVLLVPALLNAGDSITFRMLISKPTKVPIISGRIVGVKRVGESTEGRRRSLSLIVMGLLLLSFLVVSVLPRPSTGSLAGVIRFVAFFGGVLSLEAGRRSYSHFRRDLTTIFSKSGR